MGLWKDKAQRSKVRMHARQYNHHRRDWDSVTELAAEAQRPASISDDQRQSRDRPPEQKWDHGAGFDGAVNMAEHGYPELAQEIRGMADEIYEAINPAIDRNRFRTKPARTGAMVDLGHYLQGHPLKMRAFETEETPEQQVNIVVSTSVAHHVKADTIKRRGAAIAALVEALEATGRSVGVMVESSARSSGYAYTETITVKRPQEALDLDALAFALAHPAFERRLIFALEERLPEAYRSALGAGKDVSGGYGLPCNAPEKVRDELNGDLYFGKLQTHNDTEPWETEDKAAHTVKTTARDAGIDLETDERGW